MKYILTLLILFLTLGCWCGQNHHGQGHPGGSDDKRPDSWKCYSCTTDVKKRPWKHQTGLASWYGPGFNGKLAANGKPYNQNALTCAHKTLPLGSTVRVTNLNNKLSVVLKVTDRGPYVDKRIIDLSKRANEIIKCDLCHVKVEVL